MLPTSNDMSCTGNMIVALTYIEVSHLQGLTIAVGGMRKTIIFVHCALHLSLLLNKIFRCLSNYASCLLCSVSEQFYVFSMFVAESTMAFLWSRNMRLCTRGFQRSRQTVPVRHNRSVSIIRQCTWWYACHYEDSGCLGFFAATSPVDWLHSPWGIRLAGVVHQPHII